MESKLYYFIVFVATERAPGNILVKQVEEESFLANRFMESVNKRRIIGNTVITGFQRLTEKEFNNWYHQDVIEIKLDGRECF
jgi:hypothetical protein